MRRGFAMGAGVAVLVCVIGLRTMEGRTPSSAQPRDSAAKVLLAGTITLSDIHKISHPVTVFVVARDRAAGKGHPLLAKRIDVASFPTTFALGSQDSMIGQALPDRVALDAWIDTDHDAMTRETNTPSAHIDSIAIGTKDIALVLR